MRAMVFDLDDTLYNEADFVHGAFREVSGYLSAKYCIDKDKLYETMAVKLEQEGRGRIFNSVCEEYGINEDMDALVELYRRATPKISLYEDAEYFLINSKGKYKLGLITDGTYYVQWNKIRLLGIEKYFDAIIVTDDHGKEFWKPNAKPYLKMAEDLGVPLYDMVYIGDNPQKDFYGARKLGIHTVRIKRKAGDYMKLRLDSDYEADKEINSIYDLEKTLELQR